MQVNNQQKDQYKQYKDNSNNKMNEQQFNKIPSNIRHINSANDTLNSTFLNSFGSSTMINSSISSHIYKKHICDQNLNTLKNRITYLVKQSITNYRLASKTSLIVPVVQTQLGNKIIVKPLNQDQNFKQIQKQITEFITDSLQNLLIDVNTNKLTLKQCKIKFTQYLITLYSHYFKMLFQNVNEINQLKQSQQLNKIQSKEILKLNTQVEILYERMEKYMNDLINYLKTKYPRGQSYDLGEFAKKFEQFDRSEDQSHNLLTNLKISLFMPPGVYYERQQQTFTRITDSIKSLINLCIDQVNLNFQHFQSIVENQLFKIQNLQQNKTQKSAQSDTQRSAQSGTQRKTYINLNKCYKIGRKINQNTSKFSKTNTGSIEITSPAILRILIKWTESLTQIVQFPQKKIDPQHDYIYKKIDQIQNKRNYYQLNQHHSQPFNDRFQFGQTLVQQQKIQQKIQQIDYFQTKIDKQKQQLISSVKKLKIHIRKDNDYNQKHFKTFLLRIVNFLSTVQSFSTHVPHQQMQIITFSHNLSSFISWMIQRKLVRLIKIFQQINQFNTKKQNSKVKIPDLNFNVNDLMRCQYFGSKDEILQIYLNFQIMHKNKQIQVVKIKNRLNMSMNDVMIFFKIKNCPLICQCQLILNTKAKNDHQKICEEMNHFLYQLERSKFHIMGQAAVFLNYNADFMNYINKLKKKSTQQSGQQIISKCKSKFHSVEQIKQQVPFLCFRCGKYYAKYQNFQRIFRCLQCTIKLCNKCMGKIQFVSKIYLQNRMDWSYKQNWKHFLRQKIWIPFEDDKEVDQDFKPTVMQLRTYFRKNTIKIKILIQQLIQKHQQKCYGDQNIPVQQNYNIKFSKNSNFIYEYFKQFSQMNYFVIGSYYQGDFIFKRFRWYNLKNKGNINKTTQNKFHFYPKSIDEKQAQSSLDSKQWIIQNVNKKNQKYTSEQSIQFGQYDFILCLERQWKPVNCQYIQNQQSQLQQLIKQNYMKQLNNSWNLSKKRVLQQQIQIKQGQVTFIGKLLAGQKKQNYRNLLIFSDEKDNQLRKDQAQKINQKEKQKTSIAEQQKSKQQKQQEQQEQQRQQNQQEQEQQKEEQEQQRQQEQKQQEQQVQQSQGKQTQKQQTQKQQEQRQQEQENLKENKKQQKKQLQQKQVINKDNIQKQDIKQKHLRLILMDFLTGERYESMIPTKFLTNIICQIMITDFTDQKNDYKLNEAKDKYYSEISKQRINHTFTYFVALKKYAMSSVFRRLKRDYRQNVIYDDFNQEEFKYFGGLKLIFKDKLNYLILKDQEYFLTQIIFNLALHLISTKKKQQEKENQSENKQKKENQSEDKQKKENQSEDKQKTIKQDSQNKVKQNPTVKEPTQPDKKNKQSKQEVEIQKTKQIKRQNQQKNKVIRTIIKQMFANDSKYINQINKLKPVLVNQLLCIDKKQQFSALERLFKSNSNFFKKPDYEQRLRKYKDQFEQQQAKGLKHKNSTKNLYLVKYYHIKMKQAITILEFIRLTELNTILQDENIIKDDFPVSYEKISVVPRLNASDRQQKSKVSVSVSVITKDQINIPKSNKIYLSLNEIKKTQNQSQNQIKLKVSNIKDVKQPNTKYAKSQTLIPSIHQQTKTFTTNQSNLKSSLMSYDRTYSTVIQKPKQQNKSLASMMKTLPLPSNKPYIPLSLRQKQPQELINLKNKFNQLFKHNIQTKQKIITSKSIHQTKINK